MNRLFYSVELGGVTVTSLWDGTLQVRGDVILASAGERERRESLANQGVETTEYPMPLSVALIERGDETILVDGGYGANPDSGELVKSMEAAGRSPGEITQVAISHAHTDHIHGLVDAEGSPRFPKAPHFLAKAEWEAWGVEDSGDAPDENTALVRQKLAALRDRIEFVEGAHELVPSVRMVPAPGHTPGHSILEVRGEEEQMLLLGDSLLNAAQLGHPEWYEALAFDGPQAVSTRRRWLTRAAADNALVHLCHLPFPAIGRIQTEGDGFRWLPVSD